MNASLKRARHNMVEQQIRAWEVLDERVLSLYETDALSRESFVANAAHHDLAYADMALPTAGGQTMLEPKLEARMLQVLLPTADEKILHIGCGSGYFAALLGALAGRVHSMEINAELASAARARLKQTESGARVSVVHADGAAGLAQFAPYDAIVLTGSVPQVSQALFEQLADDGRLLAVVGDAPSMCLRLYQKQKTGDIVPRDILETFITPLVNVKRENAFSL